MFYVQETGSASKKKLARQHSDMLIIFVENSIREIPNFGDFQEYQEYEMHFWILLLDIRFI